MSPLKTLAQQQKAEHGIGFGGHLVFTDKPVETGRGDLLVLPDS